MTPTSPDRSTLANALRVLAMDAVQQANSGHPGMPMGMADIAEALWRHHLRHNPANPHWPDRDRFVLSNGHGSMLLYGLLHLSGYDLPIEELRQFRQLHSRTPGHPEVGVTPGVETTTGPLGQGIANAVGMALTEKLLATEFNHEGHPIVDHRTWVFLGDGCLMEGVSHEACSLAGTWGLSKLTAFWDDNGISIDGHVEGWFTDDTPARFEAYGWHVIRNVDGHDPKALDAAIAAAKAQSAKPTLICCRTVIGQGSPNKAGTHDSHGAPLGAAEVTASREKLGWTHGPFEIPGPVRHAWDAREAGALAESDWNERFVAYERAHPAQAAEFRRRVSGALPTGYAAAAQADLDRVVAKAETIASRKASQNAIAALAPQLPELVGGSADLAGSNLTMWPQACNVNRPEGGNYVHYGVREFGMAAIMNGIALHGGLRVFGGTFLMFSEYARNALRMAALMKLNPIYVFTHDSIGLGEDGPTHQPVEQSATLRLLPNMDLWRPCDAVETQIAWQQAIASRDHPTSLVLSRQNLPHQPRSAEQLAAVRRGGYVLSEADGGVPHAVVIATGSEVGLAVEAQQRLQQQGLAVRVVSMPSTFAFDQQDAAWRDQVLPRGVPRVAVEAGVTDGWRKYVGLEGAVVGLDRFGDSAPAGDLFKLFGLTVQAVVDAVQRVTVASTGGVAKGSASGAAASRSRVAAIATHGQQIWLDKLSRSLVANGELQRWLDEHAVAGVTSNPAIFAQAFEHDTAYAAPLAELRRSEPDAERRFERLAIPDVQAACDQLRALYESSDGEAGYVSFEVSPTLARNGAGTLAAARRLWAEIGRPNAMIKIPATPECQCAITAALADGININVTLMFSPRHAREVFAACRMGLQQRSDAGLPLQRLRAVASVFVSRVDAKLDAELSDPRLKGQVGIANARAIYAQWLDTFGGADFAALRAAGAHPPSCLWASTGTKNPAERDVRYVEALVGPHSVNTVPDATLAAFVDHGEAARTLDTQLPEARALMTRLAAAGIDIDAIGEALQLAGLEQFDKAHAKLMQRVA